MKKMVLIAIAWLCTSLQAYTQVDIPAFGAITPADLAARECGFEKDAPAFYLLNYAKTDFNLNYNGFYKITVERRIRIKIINQKGFEYASIAIPHLGNKHSSKITDIEAYIYTTDASGAVIKSKVEKKDIFKSTVSKKENLKIVKFTFPGLQAGCIIEYRYTHIENDSYDIEPWLFQHKIPVALSYCEINFPNFSQLDYRVIGQLPLNENDYKEWPIDSSKKIFKKVLVMKNIPSFRQEPLMTSLVDNLKRAEFSLNPTSGPFSFFSNTAEKRWTHLNSSLNMSARFGMQFTSAIAGTEKLADSIKGLKTTKEKINAVYQSVKKQVAWDKHQSMYPDDINEVWKAKEGNSAEINLIMLNLLKKAGVNCYPILISTRENGKTDPGFAHMSQFNGLDVLVFDSTDYYVLDGCSKTKSWSVPPLDVVNRDVFIIMRDGYKWATINENKHLIKDSVYINASLDKDGNITGESVTTSFNLSRDIRLSEENETDRSSNDLLSNDAAEITKDSSWIINKDDETLPLQSFTKFHFQLSSTDNFYFLNPYLFRSFRKNPFTDSARSTDVDFLCNQQYTQLIKINVPPEITMETLPRSITIRTADSTMIYSRTISQKGNILWMQNEFTVDNTIYPADEYSVLWEFFKRVYALIGEDILLIKKKQ